MLTRQATLVPTRLGEVAQTTYHAVIAARSQEITLLIHFSSLDLCKPILDAIAGEGYDTPTPIQAQSIPPVLEGRDLLGCAQTGTGKTAAFALPILNRLHTAKADKKRRGATKPRVLVLSPTRELASQIDDSFRTYGRHTGLRQTVVYGGVKQFHQVKSLKRGVDILVATPGRLMDLMEQGHVDLRFIEIFVLDEADRMLDMGFIQPIRQIAAALPAERQTLLFSATMPKNIMHLADSLLQDPVKIAVTPVASAAPLIEQSVYMVSRQAKPALIEHLLAERGVKRALIFTRTKHGADKLTRKLNHSGVKATAIHGNKAQNARQRALESFRSGQSRVLVATDVAARGLDVDGITHVFNFDLPNEPEAYVHRIGRTGRAGATGLAISFCDRSERGFLRAIERITGTGIDTVTVPDSIEVTPPPRPPREPRPHFTPHTHTDKQSTGENEDAKPRRKRTRNRDADASTTRRRRRRGDSPRQDNATRPKRNAAANHSDDPHQEGAAKPKRNAAAKRSDSPRQEGAAKPKRNASAKTKRSPSSGRARTGSHSEASAGGPKRTARTPDSRASRKRARAGGRGRRSNPS